MLCNEFSEFSLSIDMAGGAVAESGRIPRPAQLRGLHNATIKKNLIVSGILVAAVAVLVKFGRNDPRKRDYAEFYK